jgi:recombination protein RecA
LAQASKSTGIVRVSRVEGKKAVASIDDMIKNLEGRFGKGVISRIDKLAKIDVPVIPTGIAQIDHVVIQAGGVPKGKIIEIYGPEACLVGDTFIQFSVNKVDGTRINHKGGTIKRLYERFHGIRRHRLQSREEVVYTAPSINEEDRVFHNQIADVVHTGKREVFSVVTTGGHTITATADHKFYTGEKWVSLDGLYAGETVMIHNSNPFTTEPERRINQYLFVKSHKVAGIKEIFDKKTGNTYVYHRLRKHRAVMEAHLNGMSLEAYVKHLNTGNIEDLIMLPREIHVHHIDEDTTNNDLANLSMIVGEDHTRHHALKDHNNLRYIAVEDTVKLVIPRGVSDTYDIKMRSPFNNFVADKFVVHNSGKTSLALQVIAEAQALGGMVAFVDAEHGLQPKRAAQLGVDLKRMLVSQPDCGEQALEIVEALVRTGAIDVLVVDSVTALVPRAELEGEFGDSHMGLQARLMSQAMKKLTPIVAQSGTALIFINQIREKIGVMFGSPETTSGGRALKFFASLRLDIRRIGQIKVGEEIVGSRTKIKSVKNRVGSPFQEAEVDLLYATGFDKVGSWLDLAVEYKVITKSAAWHIFGTDRIANGRAAAIEALRGNPELLTQIQTATKAALVEPIVPVEVPEEGYEEELEP